MADDPGETEIRTLIADISAALQSGDASTLDTLLSDRAGCVHIGTDADEWFDKAQMLAGIDGNLSGDHGLIRIEHADISVHVQGDVAWAEGTARFVAPDGTECPIRMTGVFVKEDGEWKAAQSHASIGVPNAEMFRR